MKHRSPLAAWLLAVLLGGVLSALPGAFIRSSARAEGSVPASVLIVLGTNQGSGTDAALAKIEALRKAPFDSFSKKALLKRIDVQLVAGKPAEIELPNGRRLRLGIVERTSDGRFRVSVSINRPGKQDYLPVMTVIAAPGDPFFVAGQRHEGGTLIIGVIVGKTG